MCTTPEASRYRLRQIDAAPDGDDVDILRGAVEEEVSHIAPDDVGVYTEFVRGFADEVKEGRVYLVVDLIFLFVEQVFAEHPFLVGFLRQQRYEFLVWGRYLLWGVWFGLGCCLFHVERVRVLVLSSSSSCRYRCVVARVSRGMEDCGGAASHACAYHILRSLHRVLSSI